VVLTDDEDELPENISGVITVSSDKDDVSPLGVYVDTAAVAVHVDVKPAVNQTMKQNRDNKSG